MKNIIYFLFFGLVFAQKPSILNADFQPFNSNPYLTPTASPTTSIYINWNTEFQEPTLVAYGLTICLEDTQGIEGARNYHHVILCDLLPATEYYYKVLPDGEIKTFKTFPVHANSFAFTVLGDTRSDSVSHQSVINRMAEYEFEFMLHTGDLIYNGDDTDAWRTFFNVEDTIIQAMYFLPTIGNHEHPFWQYDTLFALPDAKYYYSTNYGNTHFIILNTEMDLYGAQRDWLIDDLVTANSDTVIDWIFVSLHRPPYSSGSHGSQQDVRDAWGSVFEDYGVDVVFAGHDHSYERTSKIDGVIYIVTAGGGAPLYPVGSSSWTAYSEMTHHFCLINIKEKKLILKAIKPDGVVLDSLIINRNSGTN